MTNQRPHCSRTLDEIRARGFEVLVESLGPADAIRFVRSYSHGSGDYTQERRVSLERDLDLVVAGILERRKEEGFAIGWLAECSNPEKPGIYIYPKMG